MACRRFSKKSGREVIEKSLPLLKDPDQGMRIIHIAGTNGKGSTAVCLNAILMEAGFRCGLFTSPHLVDFAERIQVNRKNIDHADVARIAGGLIRDPALKDCTMFDYCLLIALLYFKEQNCDYVILETGLGGRLDSTRGIHQMPVLCCITRIGFDHMEILGSTLSEIAMEKAGILRPQVPAVLAEMEEEAASVIRREAARLGVPLTQAPDYRSLLTDRYLKNLRDREQCPGLIGDYQLENMANALAMASLLLGEDVSDLDRRTVIIEEGLRKAFWSGRMQVIRREPLVLLDGAHNPQGMQAMCDSLLTMYPGRKYTFITGMLKDKDYEGMLQTMLPLADRILTVTIDEDRGLKAEDLLEALKENGSIGQIKAGESLSVASLYDSQITKFLRETSDDVVLCGSLHFIGHVMDLFRQDKTFHFEI